MNNGEEQAFPGEYENQDRSRSPIGGLTKREHFAVTILSGIAANEGLNLSGELRVKLSIEMADELLKQLCTPKN